MALKNVRYTRLETEESEEDESPPTHVEVNNGSTYVKGSKWNHIDNLDEFFERVYEYQQKNGLAAIFLGDVLELIQFVFMVVVTTVIVTCLRLDQLRAGAIVHSHDNGSNLEEKDVHFEDLFDLSRFQKINSVVVLFLLMAFVFFIQRLSKTAIRLYRFWGIRRFYQEALHIPPSELQNVEWHDVVMRLKAAQREHKMNIQKQELTELDIYHRILRFKNYMVAMINKEVIRCKFCLPFFGEKVFFTQGLKLNYEMILFWPSLKAPFRDSFYLRDEYKSAANKTTLVNNLRFRITLLAFLNLIFCPAIFLYQLLYSFFSYADLLKNQPGIFGRRRWSLYGRWYLRDFNELEHEFSLRLCRAYKPGVKYMDLFANPLVVLLAKNLAFIAGSLLAILLVLTVIQEQLLTTNYVLSVITALGLIVTVCHIFIPHENQVWQPAGLMQRILGDIHYMPDHWKQQPHTLRVYREFTHVLQFTMMFVVDELLSPLVTPFVLYFYFRPKAAEIVDFLRNFTINVSGVGDVCSFAEMNVRKHGNPEWLSEGMSAAKQCDQARLGKTEISLMHFSRKNPSWKPSEDGAQFMSHLRQSVDSMHHSFSMCGSGYGSQKDHAPNPAHSGTSITYLSVPPQDDSIVPSLQPLSHLIAHPHGQECAQASSSDAMQWSIWSAKPDSQYRVLPSPSHSPSHHHHHPSHQGAEFEGEMIGSTYDTLQIHQIHDLKKLTSSDPPPTENSNRPPLHSSNPAPSHKTTASSWSNSFSVLEAGKEDNVPVSAFQGRSKDLTKPLLVPPPPATAATAAAAAAAATQPSATPTGATEHAQMTTMTSQEFQDSFHSVGDFQDQAASSAAGYRRYSSGDGGGGSGEPSPSETTVVDLHTFTDQ